MTARKSLDMKNVDIKSRYVGKLGMILLKLKPELAQELERKYLDKEEIDEVYYDEMIALQQEIKKKFSAYADIEAVQWLSEPRKEHFEPFEHHLYEDGTMFIQQSSSFLFFKGFIPKSERKYSFDVRYIPKVIEKFNVLYSGQIFLVYSKIEDDESDAFFGQEVREFLKRILDAKKWEAIAVPPCPLHPTIYVNFVNSGSNLAGLFSPLFNKYEINYYFPIQMETQIQAIFEYLVEEHSFDTEMFLSAATLKQKSERLSWQIEDIYDDVVNKFKRVSTANKIIPFGKWVDFRHIQNLIFDLRLLLNDYSNTLFKMQKERIFLADIEHDNSIKKSLYPYVLDYLKWQPIPMNELKETILFIEKQIANKYINFYTILAAILGALTVVAISNISNIMNIFKNFFELLLQI